MLLVRTKGMLWLLFVLLALETMCYALFEPGRTATIPNIATPEQIPVAGALGAATWSIIFGAGAALGGLADVAFGRDTVFILDALSFVGSALLIRQMRFAEPHAENMPPLRFRDLVDFSPIAEGMRYVARDRKMLATVLVKGGVGLIGTNWVILPVLGQRIFPLHLAGLTVQQGGTLGMSALFASRGLGATFGALFSGTVAGTNRTRLKRTILASFLMGSIGYLVLGTAGSLVFAALAVVFAHSGSSAAWTASTTLLQEMTEDRFRGRVFSVEFAFAMLGLSISSFAAGQFADRGVDVRTLAVATGVVMLIPAAAWAWRGK
jgi:predicted MFS family arabinose efflux permease